VTVFVYGTLTDPETVAEVLDSYVFVGAAVLHGLHAVDGRYPTLAPGGSVGGRLLRTDAVAALDEYEAVEDGLYTRVSVPVVDNVTEATDHESDGSAGVAEEDPGDAGETVELYVGNPDRLGVDIDWPGTGTFPERVRQYLDAEPVVAELRD
jgi:gamma-glutamylcyclotransferase (GGCT)/AIG2-like uncharacterized protein YtfP